MNRSEINQIIRNAKEFMAIRSFILPAWAHWTPADWTLHKSVVEEVVENMMGWDITDFGSGDFYKRGLFLFTLRNGNIKRDKKPYAEKIMIVEENQETPMHFHWKKMEDIINRGGGNLVLELYMANAQEKLDQSSSVTLKVDGILTTINAGGKITLKPGESICLEPYVYHKFYGEVGKGKVLVGEVSAVNDDSNDNCFLEKIGRFPVITENEAPLNLLVSDYAKYL